MENEKVKKDNELLFRIVAALKKNWILMLVVFLIVMVAGVAYTYLKKPNYTASVTASYYIKTPDGGANEVNMTLAYFDSIVDLCDEGYVVRRANYYYGEFLKSGQSVNEFINTFVDDYNENKEVTEYIRRNNISVSKMSPLTASTNTNNDPLIIIMSYRDADSSVVANKVRILSFAVPKEANKQVDINGESVSPYLGRNELIFNWQKTSGVSADLQVRRILLITALIGVVLALLSVYLKYLFNRTVNDKDTLEDITGVSLLAYIDDQGE